MTGVQTCALPISEAGVDFELKSYPGVKHSFTVQGASEIGKRFSIPLVYDAAADKDSWQRTQTFFKEIFK